MPSPNNPPEPPNPRQSDPPFRINPVRNAADLSATRDLIKAYAQWLGIDLSFQSFASELAGLPGAYAPPGGELLLARSTAGGAAALGCAAVRALPALRGCCEMKRLYVAGAGRGLGVGRALVQAVVEAAEALGYEEIRLDTLPCMEAARALYGSVGFEACERYYETPLEGTVFLRKRIGGE